MTKPFNRETYFKTLEIIEELNAKKEQDRKEAEEAEEILRELNDTIPDSISDSAPKGVFKKFKAFLIAALVIAVALIILAGSVVIIPTVLVMIVFYLLFYAAKTSIK